MTTKIEQAARQLLFVVTGCAGRAIIHPDNEAITAMREALSEQAEHELVGYVDEALRIKWLIDYDAVSKLTGHKLYAAPVRTKDLTDFGCVPNSNGTTNQRGELLSALEALLEDYIHRVKDAWIEAGGSDISREEVLADCESARNAAIIIGGMRGVSTDELP